MILNDELLNISKNASSDKVQKLSSKILELRLKKELQKEINNSIEDEDIKYLLS